MLPTTLRRLAALSALTFATVAAVAAEPAIIAKARAYLGPEALLDGVKSVHYVGSLDAPDPNNPGKTIPVTLDIIFQAPFQQRTIRTTSMIVDTTALNDYDGWHRALNPQDPTQMRLALLPTDQIKRQRAIVWENLAFFRGLEKIGGKVIDQGSTTVDGIACHKVAFMHSDKLGFYRYFDEATGKLVLTETDGAGPIREQGEIIAGGIRFPKQIVNMTKGPDGKEQPVTITFEKITVNENFPVSTFAVPTAGKN